MTFAQALAAESERMTGPDARRARRRAKLTQAEVAGAIGITVAAYSKWETGQRGLAFERTPLEVFEAIEKLKRD